VQEVRTPFTTIYVEDLRRQIDGIHADERYWPEPLIQINPTPRTPSRGT
jgi:hypothetical protein